MVGTRWFCVSTCIHTCLHYLDPADNILTDLVSSQASHTRLGFHKEGPRNQNGVSGEVLVWPDPYEALLTGELFSQLVQ